MKINDLQTIFLVFYAIFWGYIAGVQPHWKAFHFPLVCKVKQAKRRTILAIVIFNLVPLAFFFLAMLALSGQELDGISPLRASWDYVFRGVLPAFAIFGFYRFWLAIIDCKPDIFYASDVRFIDENYRHVEPTYRRRVHDCRSTPVVDVGDSHTGRINGVVGVIYIAIAMTGLLCGR